MDYNHSPKTLSNKGRPYCNTNLVSRVDKCCLHRLPDKDKPRVFIPLVCSKQAPIQCMPLMGVVVVEAIEIEASAAHTLSRGHLSLWDTTQHESYLAKGVIPLVWTYVRVKMSPFQPYFLTLITLGSWLQSSASNLLGSNASSQRWADSGECHLLRLELGGSPTNHRLKRSFNHKRQIWASDSI